MVVFVTSRDGILIYRRLYLEIVVYLKVLMASSASSGADLRGSLLAC